MSEPRQVGDSIRDVQQLEELLSEPTGELIDMMGRLEGDIIVLGTSGKMGPTLIRMAKRASDAAGTTRRIIGAAEQFPNDLDKKLQGWGIETAMCDMLRCDRVAKLPDAENVIYMVGMKFGTTGRQAMTWAVNTAVPTMVAQRYAGSRIVVFSTGNIYGLTPVQRGGSVETDEPNPAGEYANSALGRDRIFEFYSSALGSPTTIFRLNYAVEMRYGVLVDLARQVHDEQPIDLSMGYANVIWQGDANAMAIRALEAATVPPALINAAGPEIISVREVCQKYAQMMSKPVRFTGRESPDALLSNGSRGQELLGEPRVDVEQMMVWIADWVCRGRQLSGKPTHFESRNGKF